MTKENLVNRAGGDDARGGRADPVKAEGGKVALVDAEGRLAGMITMRTSTRCSSTQRLQGQARALAGGGGDGVKDLSGGRR